LNNFNQIKNIKIEYVILVFFILVSIVSFRDFGVGWDEMVQHNIAFSNYLYICHKPTDLFTMRDRFYGVGFEMPLYYFEKLILEKLFKNGDLRIVILSRHILSHLFFLFGCFVLYRLVLKLFNDKRIAAVAMLGLLLMPRLYAHSYFNTKDIPFLVSAIFVCYYAFRSFNQPGIKNIAIWGALIGFSCSIRIVGLVFLLISIATLFTYCVAHRIDKIKTAKYITVLAGTFSLTLYILFPFLWTNPVVRLLDCFHQMSNFPWTNYVFFNGSFIFSRSLPWTYLPVWFAITTPVIWVVLGAASMLFLIFSITSSYQIWVSNTTRITLAYTFFCLVTPVAFVYINHSVVYDDWRHFYFTFPFVLILSCFLLSSIKKKYLTIFYILIVFQFLDIGWFMIKNHPFDEVYFNELVSRKPEYIRQHYELDHHGPAFKQALEFLVKYQPTGQILVSCDTNLNYPFLMNRNIIPPADRKRIVLKSADSADYFVGQYRFHPSDYPYSNILMTKKVLNSTILSVYKIR